MERIKHMTIASRVAQNADKNDYKKFMNTLDGKEKTPEVSAGFLNHISKLNEKIKTKGKDYPGRVPRRPPAPQPKGNNRGR